MSHNVLRKFFYDRDVGPGIWKWDHYFDIYERHFHKFVGKPVVVVEIGVYSGGSLDMWQHYFGPQARIIGIDIQPDCRIYERDGVSIYIGDQSSPDFWEIFRAAEPNIDIVIDDGSHIHEHQIISFEEMFSHLRRGGVYLCEDIHGNPSDFAEHVTGLCRELNLFNKRDKVGDKMNVVTPTQREINSISFYPYVCVVEKNEVEVERFIAPKQGTEWQQFSPKYKTGMRQLRGL